MSCTLLEGSATQQPAEHEEPYAIYLTWQQDPLTTMTIDWQTQPEDKAVTTLRYQIADSKCDVWMEVEAESFPFPYSDRTVHRVELKGLEPGTSYRFHAGEFNRSYSFRTMPETITEEPLVFAAGGDTRPAAWTFEEHYREELGLGAMEDLNRIALQYDVDFIVWAGDLAYADGREDRLYRWDWWFEANMNSLIDDDGRVVPILVGIGNHESLTSYVYRADDYEQTDAWRLENAPYFYTLFAFPGQPGYNVMDFGDYLSLVSLDSDHTSPVIGLQTEWLESVLAERTGIPHVFPYYHVPAFPSHRSPDGGVQTRVRENWVPLFEKYGVRVAFEAHDHAYKRTYPIRDGKIDPTGITYIGDGAWGRGPRSGNSRGEWYINKFAEEYHAIITTLHGTHQHFLIVNDSGEIIDEFPTTPRPASN